VSTGVMVTIEKCPNCGERHGWTFFRDRESGDRGLAPDVVRFAYCPSTHRRIVQHASRPVALPPGLKVRTQCPTTT